MERLHYNAACTRYLHDLLVLIHDDMVVVVSPTKQRIRSAVLLSRVRAMDGKARMDAGYILERQPREFKIQRRAVEAALNGKARETMTMLRLQLGELALLDKYSGTSERMTTQEF